LKGEEPYYFIPFKERVRVGVGVVDEADLIVEILEK